MKFDKLHHIFHGNGFGYRNDVVNEVIYQQMYEMFKEYIDNSLSSLISISSFYAHNLKKNPDDIFTVVMYDLILILTIEKSKEDKGDKSRNWDYNNSIDYRAREAFKLFTKLIQEEVIR